MSLKYRSSLCFPFLFLILLPFCIYFNSLSGEFVFDDSRIYNSPSVQLETFSIQGLVRATAGMEPSSRPVANLTFVLNYLFHKFDVRGYHVTNLIIHICAGLLLYLFLQTLFGLPTLAGKIKFPSWVAFASALIWLVHPLNTQAVSYIVQRMTSLCALFFILSMYLYARGRFAEGSDRRFFLLSGSILSGLLALGTKEIAVTLPFFILLYEWFFMQDLRRDWLVRNKRYFAAVGLFLLVVPILIMKGNLVAILFDPYAVRDFTVFERVLTEFRVLIYYLGLLVFPHPGRLSLEHDFMVSTSLFSPITTLLAVGAVLGVVVTGVLLAPRYRMVSFCILWFFGNHVVEGSILPLELVFEHRNYLPSMLFVPLLVIWIGSLVSNRHVQVLLLAGVVCVLSYWTWQRNYVWQDRISLWSDAVKKAPNVARAHNNLAVALKSKGRLKEAVHHYKETIRLDPGFVEAYYNLGNVMMLTGDLQLAVKFYREAVKLNPELAVLKQSLANALFDSGRFEEAKYYYIRVLQLEPKNVAAKMDLERSVRMIESIKLRKQRQEN